MLVLMEHSAESVVSSYVKARDLAGSCQRRGQWVERAGVRDALVRPVPVIELLELSQGVQKVGLVPDQRAVQLAPAGLHPPFLILRLACSITASTCSRALAPSAPHQDDGSWRTSGAWQGALAKNQQDCGFT